MSSWIARLAMHLFVREKISQAAHFPTMSQTWLTWQKSRNDLLCSLEYSFTLVPTWYSHSTSPNISLSLPFNSYLTDAARKCWKRKSHLISTCNYKRIITRNNIKITNYYSTIWFLFSTLKKVYNSHNEIWNNFVNSIVRSNKH